MKKLLLPVLLVGAARMLAMNTNNDVNIVSEAENRAYFVGQNNVEDDSFVDCTLSSNTSVDDSFPLHDAVRVDDVTEVKKLIVSGAKVTTRNSFGQTPLHVVGTMDNSIAIATLLLDNHANVNAKDQGGNTPLHYAIQNCHEKLVTLLFLRGGKVDEKNKDGISPRSYAKSVYKDNSPRNPIKRLLGMQSKPAKTFKHIYDEINKSPRHNRGRSSSVPLLKLKD